MVLMVIQATLAVQAVTHGKGKRTIDLSDAQLHYINMNSWFAKHVVYATFALTKTSVCLLVIMIKPEKKLKIFVGVVSVALVAACIEVSIVLLAQCRPISAQMAWT